MRRFAGSVSLVIATVLPAVLPAQSAPAAPQIRVLSVFRETVKPGKGASHDVLEEAWARAAAAAKSPTHYLAASAMSGAPEIWYLSGFPSWADYEKSNQAGQAPALAAIDKQYRSQEGEYLSDSRGMVLTRRDDLSYGPPADLASSRYFSITRIATRQGHTAEYVENRKMVKAAHEAAHLSDSYSMWQAAAGAPAGTFFLIVARKSLAELDSGGTIHGAAYQTALGGAEAQKKMNDNAANAIINSETNTFAFLPGQSLVPAEWIAADPGFWKPKPAPKKLP